MLPAADVEEEVRRALVVAVLEQLDEREAEQVLVEADRALGIGADQREVVHAAAVRLRPLAPGGGTASRSVGPAWREGREVTCRRVAMHCIIARGCSRHEGRRLPSQRRTRRWTRASARGGWSSGPGPRRDAGLDSLFVGDHHNVPVPYYQNVPMLGRLLAEWDDRPAGALFLLPLWHPVLLAEQIGTLASIARGPVHHAVRGRRRRRAVPTRSARRSATRPSRFEAALDIVRRAVRAARR